MKMGLAVHDRGQGKADQLVTAAADPQPPFARGVRDQRCIVGDDVVTYLTAAVGSKQLGRFALDARQMREVG